MGFLLIRPGFLLKSTCWKIYERNKLKINTETAQSTQKYWMLHFISIEEISTTYILQLWCTIFMNVSLTF